MTSNKQANQLEAFLLAVAIADGDERNYWHEFRRLALRECKKLDITLLEFIKLSFGLESPDITWIKPESLIQGMLEDIQENPNFKK